MKTLLAAFAALAALPAAAQINVDAGGTRVVIGADGAVDVRTPDAKVTTGGKGGVTAKSKAGGSSAVVSGSGNSAGVTTGGIAGEAEVTGVSVVNGRVFIDGKEIPPNVTRYKSPRTGEVYAIKRKGSSVEVTSE